MREQRHSGPGNRKANRGFAEATGPDMAAAEAGAGIFILQRRPEPDKGCLLRLELNGTLRSWALQQWPSLAPMRGRLAVRLQDRPLEQPSKDALPWDSGLWVPLEDPDEGMEAGSLGFMLCGNRLRGAWSLKRSKGQRWLLVKGHDEEAAQGRAAPLQEALPAGRVLTRAAMPDIMRPQLASPARTPPVGSGWLHELKYDGYRLLARVRSGKAELFTRGSSDWSARFPAIASALAGLRLRQGWLDGEVVAMNKDGLAGFERLQSALAAGSDKGLLYFIFDIIHYNGYSLQKAPLSERKLLAAALLRPERAAQSVLRLSQHVEGEGPELFRQACASGAEGIVSKQKGSRYVQGRSRAWLKAKCRLRQEFVVGGYCLPSGGGGGLGALLLGVFDSGGHLVYRGRVGTGFTAGSAVRIREKLRALERPGPAYLDPPASAEAAGVRWVEPALVAEVEYASQTRDGLLRHPSFKGLREDKLAAEVLQEGGRRPRRGSARITNIDRVYYPEGGFTKRDLIGYYKEVAALMLPHLAGRPLTLVRCPEGYDKGCFFQKRPEQSLSGQIIRMPTGRGGGSRPGYLTVETPEGITALAQSGVLEIHSCNSRSADIERPDRLVFDLDPEESTGWDRTVEAAYLMRALLDELGLASFVKATGGKGLHVVVPILPELYWAGIKDFSRALAVFISRGLPDRFTSVMAKPARAGKIFLDYMRNMRGATAVEAWSTRASKGAPIAAPLRWEELPEVGPKAFNLTNIRQRLKEAGNPWEGYMEVRQPITDAMKRRLGMAS